MIKAAELAREHHRQQFASNSALLSPVVSLYTKTLANEIACRNWPSSFVAYLNARERAHREKIGRRKMYFICMGFERRGEWAQLPQAEQQRRIRKHQEGLSRLYAERVATARPYLSMSVGLHDDAAETVVRYDGTHAVVTDGPFECAVMIALPSLTPSSSSPRSRAPSTAANLSASAINPVEGNLGRSSTIATPVESV
ncbi:MAG: hypothetical protein WCD12_03650 [Candidatus Binatus sp.]|uniref:hypothetical protein n=1 Tax=Candidatus Binatus sp. TaxID=2811406 RepID=UPI003C76C451